MLNGAACLHVHVIECFIFVMLGSESCGYGTFQLLVHVCSLRPRASGGETVCFICYFNANKQPDLVCTRFQVSK